MGGVQRQRCDQRPHPECRGCGGWQGSPTEGLDLWGHHFVAGVCLWGGVARSGPLQESPRHFVLWFCGLRLWKKSTDDLEPGGRPLCGKRIRFVPLCGSNHQGGIFGGGCASGLCRRSGSGRQFNRQFSRARACHHESTGGVDYQHGGQCFPLRGCFESWNQYPFQ